MKKYAKMLLALAGMFVAENLTAEVRFHLDMGLELPFAFTDVVSKESGTTSELGKVTKNESSADFRFKLEDERKGVELNFKPKFKPQGGVSVMDLDCYSAWFKPTSTITVSAGTSDDRHWFKGAEERLVEKFGEITIIDCYADNELGVYYGLIANPLLRNKDESFWRPWGHEEGTIRWERSYGWASSQLGTGTNVRVAYGNGERGLFATGALVERYWPNSGNQDEYEWNNSSWDSGDKNSFIWVPEVQGKVGYAFRNGSVELIYKTPHFGNNIVSLFYQPRLLREKLIGTVGFTFANDVADGSAKYHGRANEFIAFAFDARAQYKISEKLRAKLFFNYSQVTPGDNNAYQDGHEFALTSPRYHYLNSDSKKVGNKPEQGMYVVSSLGYALETGMLNLDLGYYMRDLDNNDGYNVGENYLTLKGGYTWDIIPSVKLAFGGAWYHRVNTSDYGKDLNGYTMDGIKDEFTLGSKVIIKLGL